MTYDPADYLDLHDFRQRTLSMYRARDQALGAGDDPAAVAAQFRAARDEIFAVHPQSALTPVDRESFQGLHYFPYYPQACVEAVVDATVEPERQVITTSDEESMPMSRVGRVFFSFEDQPAALTLYWIDVYGGGLFLPIRDTTAPMETYGGGRYLFDTIKGSSFRTIAREGKRVRILLDFNYAYNPSCAYNPHWACPLAPLENHLLFRVEAGEKKYK
jgi:uncharacterized protein (DUF1684 family)